MFCIGILRVKNINKTIKDHFELYPWCWNIVCYLDWDHIHVRQVHNYHKPLLSLHSNRIDSKEVWERQQVGHGEEQFPASGDRGQTTLNVTCADDACTVLRWHFPGTPPVSESNHTEWIKTTDSHTAFSRFYSTSTSREPEDNDHYHLHNNKMKIKTG